VKGDSPKQVPTLIERSSVSMKLKIKRRASSIIENKIYKDYDIAWT